MKMKLSLLTLLLTMLSQASVAESRRIEVYPLGQQYWDTKKGETLGEIVKRLLPNNPRMHSSLIKDIVALNPDVFHKKDANQMKANIRIWLPSHITRPDTVVNKSQTRVESFVWGNIKRPKR